MKKVLVTGDFDLPKIEYSKELTIKHLRTPKSSEEVITELKESWGYILGGPEYLSKDILEQVPNLQELVVMGTGTNSFVDIVAAEKYGLNISNTPALNIGAVAEFTLAQIINSLSNLYFAIDELKNGNSWYQGQRKSLQDAKIGIIGMGNIGKELLTKLHVLGAKDISYWNRTEKNIECKFKDIDSLLSESDIVCIHLKYTNETHHLLNEKNLKNDSLKILNMSNPNIVDPTALRNFLLNNPQSSFFIDGYYNEWIANQGIDNDEYNLLSLPVKNFVASSHIAAQEEKTVQTIFTKAYEILREKVL